MPQGIFPPKSYPREENSSLGKHLLWCLKELFSSSKLTLGKKTIPWGDICCNAPRNCFLPIITSRMKTIPFGDICCNAQRRNTIAQGRPKIFMGASSVFMLNVTLFILTISNIKAPSWYQGYHICLSSMGFMVYFNWISKIDGQMLNSAKIKLVTNCLNGTFMILFGTLPPPILRVQGMAFHNIPIKHDEWLNPFYSMGQNFLDLHKIMKTLTCNFMYNYLLDPFPTMFPLELQPIMATILE